MRTQNHSPSVYDSLVTNIRDAAACRLAFMDAIPIAGVRRGEIDIGLHWSIGRSS